MRRHTKFLLTLLTVGILVIGCATIVFAATVTNSERGIKVTIETDKDSYTTSETAEVNVEVENTNSYEIKEVLIENIIPSGLQSTTSADLEITEDLAPGEKVNFSLKLQRSTTSSSSSSSRSTSSSSSRSTSSNPQTGDGSDGGFPYFLLGLASLAILCVAIKHKKKFGQFLSLGLCFLLLAAYIPTIQVSASSMPESGSSSEIPSSSSSSTEIPSSSSSSSVSSSSQSSTANEDFSFETIKVIRMGSNDYRFRVEVSFTDETQSQSDSSIQLNASAAAVNVGSESEVVFYASAPKKVDSIELVDVNSGKTYEMKDNGDVLGGDDIKDDGVYSVKVELDTSKKQQLVFQAKDDQGPSNEITIDVLAVLSDTEITQVQSTLTTLHNQFLSIVKEEGANNAKAKQAMLAFAKEMESDKEIANVKTDPSNPALLLFEYAGGAPGGYLMEELSADTRSSDSSEPPVIGEDPSGSSSAGPRVETRPEQEQEGETPSSVASVPASASSSLLEIPTGELPETQEPENPESAAIFETIRAYHAQLVAAQGANNQAVKDALYAYLVTLEENGTIYDLTISETDPNLITYTDFDYNLYRYHMDYSLEGEVSAEITPSTNQLPAVAGASNKDMVGNANVLILNAFAQNAQAYAAHNAPYTQVAKKFAESEYAFQVTNKYDATVADFQNMAGYGSLFINAHGQLYADNPAIVLEETATPLTMKAYNNDIVSGRILIVGGGSLQPADTAGKYWITKDFLANYAANGKVLSNAYVHLAICNGLVNDSLAEAFVASGAAAVTSYTQAVSVEYDAELVEKIADGLLLGKTVEQALQSACNAAGEADPAHPATSLHVAGNAALRVINTGLVNGSFEDASFHGWSLTGDSRILSWLGPLTPTEGQQMSILSTGLGSISDSNSMITQTIRVPSSADTLAFSYNFVSEEPMEFIGSKYDDAFIAKIMDAQGNDLAIMAEETINASTWFEAEGIDFDGGDQTVYQTEWSEVKFDVTDYQGKIIVLCFWVYDRGDSLYDSAALVDDVRFISAAA